MWQPRWLLLPQPVIAESASCSGRTYLASLRDSGTMCGFVGCWAWWSATHCRASLITALTSFQCHESAGTRSMRESICQPKYMKYMKYRYTKSRLEEVQSEVQASHASHHLDLLPVPRVYRDQGFVQGQVSAQIAKLQGLLLLPYWSENVQPIHAQHVPCLFSTMRFSRHSRFPHQF